MGLSEAGEAATRTPLDERPGRKVVAVGEHLYVANCADLERRVLDELATGERYVELDFSGTTLVDTAALGTLVMLNRTARSIGGIMKLTNLNAGVRQLLRTTKLDAMFDLVEAANEA
ncbi:MAG: STAS domain-containing protein [Gemmatimonadaceae bacterium]